MIDSALPAWFESGSLVVLLLILIADVLIIFKRPHIPAMRESAIWVSLYAGLAITPDGPSVVEFNCRFGDPETQVVLALLESPLGGLLYATATGALADFPALQWQHGNAVTVVLAAHNYPGSPRVGDVITGSDGEGILHAGTARGEDGSVVSTGGRVLSVVATGTDLAAARDAVYRRLAGIGLPGGHFRSDIALAAAEGKIAL